jgi:hypothetical protein
MRAHRPTQGFDIKPTGRADVFKLGLRPYHDTDGPPLPPPETRTACGRG